VTPFSGLEFRVCEHLAGSKRAVRFGGGPIHLSPAMYELVSKADSPEELERLLGAIPLLTLPGLPGPFEPLPMTTTPPPEPPSWRRFFA
jgi:hypothetical protein